MFAVKYTIATRPDFFKDVPYTAYEGNRLLEGVFLSLSLLPFGKIAGGTQVFCRRYAQST
jgi:hypothetical protein